MTPHFPRTSSRLSGDTGTGRTVALAVAALLLGAWTAWFLTAIVAVFAVSDRARLEVNRSPVPVESPVAGIVTASHLSLGRDVVEGEVLVSLDLRAQALDVREEEARVGGLAPQIARLRAEIDAQTDSHRAQQAASALAEHEARARHEEAVAASTLAANAADRTRALAREGLASDAELTRVESEAVQRNAAAAALEQAVRRIAVSRVHDDTEHRVRLERLEREIALLRAQAGTGAASVRRLQHQQTLRQITAPISGRLAEVATLPAGHVLRTGDAVATILPTGTLRIVAMLTAAEAFGRVRAGQPARLRLDGFPPTQYGAVRALVSDVATELRDGGVRVELALAGSNPAIPLQHGLPGSVEIEVERLTPARLLLRAVGRRLSPRLSASEAR